MAGALEGKSALITGGTSGMGLATAQRFVAEGAKVTVTGGSQESVAVAKAELGETAQIIRSDGANAEDITGLLAEIRAHYGTLDVLFLNAGIARFAPVAATEIAEFDRQIALNCRGVWLGLQAAIPMLSDGASVIVTTSIANRSGAPNAGAYAASKAAAAQIVRTAAKELAGRAIRVNALSPGPIDTPIIDKLGLPPEQLEGLRGQIASSVALGRFGRPEEIAATALFLASDEASFITGQEIIVDGGASL
ncbi:MAG: SDR family oxidoreductase [Pseudomonadota bacterium]